MRNNFNVISIFIILIFNISTVFGMQHYYNVDFSTGLVTAILFANEPV